MREVGGILLSLKSLLCLFCILIFSGCSASSKPIAPQETYYYHTIKYPGETLGLIARWYTGNTNQWQLIAEANNGIDPARLRIGQEILIPENIMITQNPLPKSAISGSTPSKKSEAVAAKSEEIVIESEEVIEEQEAEVIVDTIEEEKPLVFEEEPINEVEFDASDENEIEDTVQVESDSTERLEPTEEDLFEHGEESSDRDRLLDELLAEDL